MQSRIINNRQDLWPLANELRRMRTKSALQLFDLITRRQNQVILATISKHDSSLYAKLASITIKPGSVVSMSSNGFRHLLNSGHITGYSKEGRSVNRRLSAQDLCNIKKVIKRPDLITKDRINPRNGCCRIRLERQLQNNHRLILEITKDHNLHVVTFFNIKSKAE